MGESDKNQKKCYEAERKESVREKEKKGRHGKEKRIKGRMIERKIGTKNVKKKNARAEK